MTRHAIGIDVGGTKIAGALVELSTARIVTKEIIPTRPARGGQAVLRDTLALAERLKTHAADVPVTGIGVSICELVNLQGEIRSDNLIKWRELPVQQAFDAIAPTRFESDARAPAIAEARFGAGAPHRNFLYLTIGTGISYCLVLEGRPYAGAHGHAIIAASGLQSVHCESCGATQERSLEDFAAGPALVTRYNRRAAAPLHTGLDIAAAAAANDPIAQEILASAGAAVGDTAAVLINALDPEALIIAGGLGLSGRIYWDSFIASTRRRIWAEECRNLPILMARLGADAGVVGAALYAPSDRSSDALRGKN